MKVRSVDLSFASYDDPGDVKEGFYLSKVDYQYVIHDGLGPYFKQILVFY